MISTGLMMRRTIAGLIVFILLAAPAAADDTYEVVVQNNVMVPMRDGVRLATDLYLPATDGQPIIKRWPTVLMRSPYDKSNDRADGEYFARHGYSVVYQDTRGRYRSEGVW